MCLCYRLPLMSCSKSTITRLLYRFFDIEQGSITIDGQPIDKVRRLLLYWPCFCIAVSANLQRITLSLTAGSLVCLLASHRCAVLSGNLR